MKSNYILGKMTLHKNENGYYPRLKPENYRIMETINYEYINPLRKLLWRTRNRTFNVMIEKNAFNDWFYSEPVNSLYEEARKECKLIDRVLKVLNWSLEQ